MGEWWKYGVGGGVDKKLGDHWQILWMVIESVLINRFLGVRKYCKWLVRCQCVVNGLCFCFD